MAVLTFCALAVRRVVDHAKAAPEHDMGGTRYPPQPAVILAGDRGVYLMSNGLPRDQRSPQKPGNYVAFAEGMNPNIDPSCRDTKIKAYGRDDGADTLLIINDLFLLLERGEETLKLEITEEHIGVLMPDVAWIKPGVMADTPSGLGGSFRVEILSVSNTHASVKTKGCSEDFDDMPPFEAPLGKLRPLKEKETT